MNEPLGVLFEQFVKERRYLKAVSPETVIWYDTAWKAYKASQTTLDERGGLTLTKQGPQVFVVHLGDRGVKPRSVNTYLQVMNAFSRWLHAEGHATELLRIAPLKNREEDPRHLYGSAAAPITRFQASHLQPVADLCSCGHHP